MDGVVAHSRNAIRAGSKSFAAASALFDRETRERAWQLYAWCRHCDDVIDGQTLGGELDTSLAGQAERLELLRRWTHLALETDDPVPEDFEAFRRTARLSGLPARHAFTLLDGFGMDVEDRRYETLADTLDYCFHVAGVVGVMMAYVMGFKERPTLDRASDLGIAFQLTNISRDVMEDARAGRLYLPADRLRAHGVEPTAEALLDPANRRGAAAVTAEILAVADDYYRSSRAGVAVLPLRAAWAVAAARDVYREIGRLVLRRGPRAWDHRAGASTLRKLYLLGRAGAVAVATRLPIRHRDREGLWTMSA